MWAVLFPGQGSQHVGMGKFLFENFRSTQLLFEETGDLLQQDFKRLCFEGPESDLTLTENTQPALLLVSTALQRVIAETAGTTFSFAAGHSLGEYSALVAGQVLQFGEAVRAVQTRGRFMQEAVPVGKGAMVAILGLEDDDVGVLARWVNEETGQVFEAANFNAPGQIVASGSKTAVDWLLANFKAEKLGWTDKRAKFIPLNVSAPFHSSMMKPAQEKMELILKAIHFRDSDVPVIQNVTAEPVTEHAALKQNLITQISSPVLWAQSVKKMRTLGVTKVLECGPGKVLSGLTKKIDREIVPFNIQSLEELKAFETATRSP